MHQGTQRTGCVGGNVFCDVAQETQCPHIPMDVASGVHEGTVDYWKCCGVNQQPPPEKVWNKAGRTKKGNNCWEPESQLEGFLPARANYRFIPDAVPPKCATAFVAGMDKNTQCIVNDE